MFDLHSLVRPHLLGLQPYSSARDEYTGSEGVFLDANENPFGELNRYPDPLQKALKQQLGAVKQIPEENIFIGNGSDEVIDLVFRFFCRPGEDEALIFTPTYGMYEVAAAIHDAPLRKEPLTGDFQIDLASIPRILSNPSLKLIFICSPNNPTGNLIDREAIRQLLEGFRGIVVVDEAYADFSEQPSWKEAIAEFPNLIVMQTLSKAWGLAAARIGMAFADARIISLFNKIKPPYNVSALNQEAAIEALGRKDMFEARRAVILSEKERLLRVLQDFSFVKKVHPSDANFLLVEMADGPGAYQFLLEKKIIIRNRHGQAPNCVRITVGSPQENDRLIRALQAYGGEENEDGEEKNGGRQAKVERSTSETQIAVTLRLDGKGKGDIRTGLPFFDHMLDQLARHGGMDLSIRTKGDLEIDEHHTIEDTALALGQAFREALGNKAGIERYGFLLPMDDCLAQVAIDFGGRPWLVWDADFRREKIGGMPTEMFMHFFKSFSDAAQCNLNIKAEGTNEHHKIESIFKAFARAIRMAVRRNGEEGVPSTKGIL
jgi:histidinol-phosphate aminotransferase